MGPATILRYLADAAAAGAPPGAPAALDITRAAEPPEWIGTRLPMPRDLPRPGEVLGDALDTLTATPGLRRLAALDALQPIERVLRLGWVVAAGTIPIDGEPTPVCLPLISQPIRLRRGIGGLRVVMSEPPELTPLVADPEVAARLESEAADGGGALVAGAWPEATAAHLARLDHLQEWIRAVVAAAGLPRLAAVLPPDEHPAAHRDQTRLVACVGAVVFLANDPLRPSLEGSLRAWAIVPDLDRTAFAALYGSATAGPAGGEPVINPLVLSPAQRAAVVRARHAPVTVVTGPPGTGKSHTVAAIAADAVAAGRSVLIATCSTHAAGVVADLLARQPGPDAVRFGGPEHDEIVGRISHQGSSGDDLDRARAELDRARSHQRLAEEAVTAGLTLERRAEQARHWDGLVDRLSALAPTVFDPGCPTDALVSLAALSEQAGRAVTGAGPRAWWARHRRARATRRLARQLGAEPTTLLVDLCTALECAADRRARAELEARGGTVLAPRWDHLVAADAEVRAAAGRLTEALGASEDRRRRGRRAAGDLAAALRAGRRQRRRLLRDIDGAAVVAALPLWVGTLRDVEDLLPSTPGLFDLVVLDEASQIDQPAAAGSLLRARRAVVVGDPHQLRHVSFVGDDAQARALEAHGLEPQAARLDVRRTSILDLAAGGAPTVWLDEHYRSVPHLIEFSARHFYGGRLHIATRHPANEATDAIDVVRLPAGDGGWQAEVDAALAAVARLAAGARTDIAVVSPFREVADAAQEALLARYGLEDVERLGLRVGTVHAFQGAEADHVVLALGLAPDDPPGRRRFVEDRHLFNVMVTRARRSLVVVTSLPPPTGPPDGLVEEYLVHADRPPRLPGDGACPTRWGELVAQELHDGGVTVRRGYPVGGWTVDLCVGDGPGAVGVETAVHPGGAAAHVDRHRALVAAGWRLVDGYPTRWDDDPTRAAVELAAADDYSIAG